MLVDIKELNKSSKVWIYTCNRTFEEKEIAQINSILAQFVDSWQRHGENLKASFEIRYDQFIVLAVDESYNDISGCSIDASVNVIQQIENEFSVDLTNKLNLAFKTNDDINIVSYLDFQKYVQLGKIKPTTVVYNNMVASIDEYNEKWEGPASNSWHNRMFSQK